MDGKFARFRFVKLLPFNKYKLRQQKTQNLKINFLSKGLYFFFGGGGVASLPEKVVGKIAKLNRGMASNCYISKAEPNNPFELIID